MELSIYIHIPFCVSKCFYCDFLSFKRTEFDTDIYVKAILKEIKAFNLEGYSIKTVYIGGGTPTILKPSDIYKMLNCFEISSGTEITIEANPGTLSRDMLQELKSIGINRLSIGLQAWQDRLLRILGRVHTNQEFLESYNYAVQSGFSNISVDIMFGLPTQTMEDLDSTIQKITDLDIQHISAYSLILEEGTKFFNIYDPIDEDLELCMYEHVIRELEQKGYDRYEISNFAKSGFESKHNTVYWKRNNYVGFGLGAHSFVNGVRYSNTDVYEQYINNPLDTKQDIEKISIQDAMSEFIFLGLRMTQGISVQQFQQLFGESIFDIYGNKLEFFKENGFLMYDKSKIALTAKGFYVSNNIFSEFL